MNTNVARRLGGGSQRIRILASGYGVGRGAIGARESYFEVKLFKPKKVIGAQLQLHPAALKGSVDERSFWVISASLHKIQTESLRSESPPPANARAETPLMRRGAHAQSEITV